MSKILIVNEGFAASSTKDAESLSKVAVDYLRLKYCISIKDVLIVQSADKDSIDDILNFVLKHPTADEIIWLGKSYGVTENTRLLKKYYDELFRYFKKITLFCVDGYSAMPWGFGGWKRSFKKLPEWTNVMVWNIYQNDKGLRGAKFKGADIQYRVRNTSHKEIIHAPMTKALIERI